MSSRRIATHVASHPCDSSGISPDRYASAIAYAGGRLGQQRAVLRGREGVVEKIDEPTRRCGEEYVFAATRGLRHPGIHPVAAEVLVPATLVFDVLFLWFALALDSF